MKIWYGEIPDSRNRRCKITMINIDSCIFGDMSGILYIGHQDIILKEGYNLVYKKEIETWNIVKTD